MSRRWLVTAALLAVPCGLLVIQAALAGAAATAILLPLVVPFSALGALLAARLPRNPVGWALFAMGAGIALEEAGLAYAAANLPGGRWVWWLVSWLWIVGLLGLLVVIPLTFPDGRLPSRFARWALAAGGVGAALLIVGNTLLRSQTVLNGTAIANPLGIGGADPAADVVAGVGAAVFAASVVAAAATAVGRYRRAAGTERAQLRWFAAAAVVLVAALLGMALVYESGHPQAAQILMGVLAPASPAAIAVAMLRYRLYAIDRLISRTVSYALLTGVLAGVYLAAVVALQAVLRPIAGPSELAVAGATLAAAAVFAPARRRLQTTVDRRFNRARYDGVHTVAAFRDRVRDETSGDRIRHQLAHVTAAAVEPTAVAVWLPAPKGTP